MIFIILAIAFLVAIAFVNVPRRLEFSKEDSNRFIDECLNMEKRINKCKTVGEVESLISNEFIMLRNKYRNVVADKFYKKMLGNLYSHGYNHINKKRK